MMINPTTKADKLRLVLDDSQATALIAPAARLRAMGEALTGAPHLRLAIASGQTNPSVLPGRRCINLDDIRHRAGDDVPPPKRAIDLDLAALAYTSGSTGTPKGVVLTHANIVSAITSIAGYLET